MSDDPQPISASDQLAVPPALSESSPKANGSKAALWGLPVLAVVAILVVVCGCVVLCVGLVAYNGLTAFQEREPIQAVMESFMQHMEAKDVKSAYALFSPRAQRQIPIAEIEKMNTGNNYILFKGYRSLKITNINISSSANTNPDIPQGIVAKLAGTIQYSGSIQGSFTSTLEKVDDQWMIDAIYVTVPPDKFK